VSDDPAAQVRELATKLGELAERLRDPEVGDQQAAELAREAAELVSQAGNEIDRALSEADSDGS
jgi:methyl-accepting chemotaxis protein